MSTGETPKQVQTIDVKRVFHNKNPKLARFIPGFLYRYLERIIHQEEINQFLKEYGNRYNIDFIEAAIKEFNVTIHIEGIENIPEKGKYIIAANHPLGGFDGIILMKIMSKYYKSFKFLVNDILMNLENINDLFIPINKHGKQASEAVKTIDETFRSESQILTFPAGLVSRKIKGVIIDLPWHKNFIVKAIKYQRDIIPVHFSGRNTNFFYRLANLRKFLGIKANIEMLYLVDETFRHKGKKLVVKFGKPIQWQTFDKSRHPREWALWVKKQVYALNGEYNIPF
ncbi:MAG: 1-acyl-sn-glycerol-3-phosphate acyltransferase [Bacteroidales bacterium]|nr:1-acyl-sn-glycerol-3-phosphate acyltransferase [Bacteroidales bacterium]